MMPGNILGSLWLIEETGMGGCSEIMSGGTDVGAGAIAPSTMVGSPVDESPRPELIDSGIAGCVPMLVERPVLWLGDVGPWLLNPLVEAFEERRG